MVVVGLLLVLVGLVVTDVMLVAATATSTTPRWWTAVPLLVAGIGSGLVISPNQTLTLAHVPVQRAGIAGGVIQTGQRIGTAAGIALVGSVYFATLSSSHGDDAGPPATGCGSPPRSPPWRSWWESSTCSGAAAAAVREPGAQPLHAERGHPGEHQPREVERQLQQ